MSQQSSKSKVGGKEQRGFWSDVFNQVFSRETAIKIANGVAVTVGVALVTKGASAGVSAAKKQWYSKRPEGNVYAFKSKSQVK